VTGRSTPVPGAASNLQPAVLDVFKRRCNSDAAAPEDRRAPLKRRQESLAIFSKRLAPGARQPQELRGHFFACESNLPAYDSIHDAN
jgi:hypothetical protein